MPIFEFKCNKCGHNTEFLEKSSGKNKHVCEKCGSSDMQKLFFRFLRWAKQPGERFMLNRNVSNRNMWTLIERVVYEDCSNVNRAYSR